MSKKFEKTNPAFTLAAATIDLERVTNPDFPEINDIALSDIHPNPDQPRKFFDEADIQGLASSIEAHGLKQPILIRRRPEGGYMLVAGERRYRAHKLLGRTTILSIVTSDREDVEVTALVENLQRVDLTPVEAGRALLRLQQRAADAGERLTQDSLAKYIGKSQSEVTRLLNITKLPEPVLAEYGLIYKDVSKSALTELLGIEEEGTTLRLWALVKEGASVAEIRKIKASLRDNRSHSAVREAPAKHDAVAKARKQWQTISAGLTSQEFRSEDLSDEDREALRRLRDTITNIIGT